MERSTNNASQGGSSANEDPLPQSAHFRLILNDPTGTEVASLHSAAAQVGGVPLSDDGPDGPDDVSPSSVMAEVLLMAERPAPQLYLDRHAKERAEC